MIISQKTLLPRTAQPALPLTVKRSRAPLVSLAFVRDLFEVDDDTVLAMANNARHEQHLQFVFDISAGAGRIAEYRFFRGEIIDRHHYADCTIDQVIEEILGARETFRRTELDLLLGATDPHIFKLIGQDTLLETGNRILAASLKNFLKQRWIGGKQP